MDESYEFMDCDFSDAVEPAVLDEGSEAQLEITDATANGEKRYVLLKCRVLNQSTPTKSVRHFLFYPKVDDDAEKINNKKLMIKSAFSAFGIPTGTIDPQSMVGCTGWCILGIEESAEYGRQNVVKGFSKAA